MDKSMQKAILQAVYGVLQEDKNISGVVVIAEFEGDVLMSANFDNVDLNNVKKSTAIQSSNVSEFATEFNNNLE